MADVQRSIEVVPMPELVRPVAKRADALQELENQVIEKNLQVFADAAHFGELDPESPDDIPLEWEIELGPERAREKHRIARYALMSAKEAPVGLQMSKAIVTAAIKAKAERSTRIGQLNIGKVMIVGTQHNYEEIEVTDER